MTEVKYSEAVDGSLGYTNYIFIAHCVLEFPIHLVLIFIRGLMVAATVVMEALLFPSDAKQRCSWSYKTDYEINIGASNTQNKREQAYQNAGEQIRLINQIFETWFPLPWLAVLIEMFISHDKDELKPWSINDVTTLYMAASYQIIHVLYHIMLLALAFECGYKFIAIHKRYFRSMEEQHGELRHFDKRNNFTPKLFCGSIEIPLLVAVSIFITIIMITSAMSYRILDFTTHP